MSKRRMDVPAELEEIINYVSTKETVKLQEIGLLSGYSSYVSQKGWALYRVQILVSEGKLVKVKSGRYRYELQG